MPLRQHAGRHHRAQRRDEDRQGRPDRALGRHLRPARRQGRGLRPAASSTRARCAWCRPSAWRPSARCRNPDNQNIVIGKAGRQRWLGRRPVVRGVAMNPVDHPHGGGEGRTSGGRHPVTPWGKPTKGKKTRKNKATDKFIVRRRQRDALTRRSAQWHVPFGRVRSSTGTSSRRPRRRARHGPQRSDQDLVAALDDPAAVRRPDVRRLQRPEVHAGAASPRTWSATSSASSRRPAPSTATRGDKKVRRS